MIFMSPMIKIKLYNKTLFRRSVLLVDFNSHRVVVFNERTAPTRLFVPAAKLLTTINDSTVTKTNATAIRNIFY